MRLGFTNQEKEAQRAKEFVKVTQLVSDGVGIWTWAPHSSLRAEPVH